jgi:hypothetical protein
MTRSIFLALLIAFAALAPRVAMGADFVVVQALGLNLKPGQLIDGSQPLKLADGQQVVLISATGVTIKLRGPFDGTPTQKDTSSQTDVTGALKALIIQQRARSDKIAAVRGATPEPIPPEPWLIDVTHVGNRCVLGGHGVVLWRPGGGAATKLIITPYDHSWQASSDWPRGTERVILPPSVPLRDQTAYVMSLADKEIAITFLVIPATVTNDAMRVAWMTEEGCESQAQALLNNVR